MRHTPSIVRTLCSPPLIAPTVIVVLVVLLAAADWILMPERGARWLEKMLLLPMFGLALAVWHRSTLKSLRRRGVEDESGVRRYALSALALIVFAIGIRQIAVLGLELWIRLGNRSGDLELEHRILGLASSVIVIGIGNALPKILTPFALLPPERAALVTVARRYIGNCWVVLGLVMALAFLLAPIGFARTLQAWGMIAGLAVMLGAIVWMNLAPDRPSHDQ